MKKKLFLGLAGLIVVAGLIAVLVTTLPVSASATPTPSPSPTPTPTATYPPMAFNVVNGTVNLTLGGEGGNLSDLSVASNTSCDGTFPVIFSQGTSNNSRTFIVDGDNFSHTPIFFPDPLGIGQDFYLKLTFEEDASGTLYLANGVGDVDVSSTTNNTTTSYVMGDGTADPAGSALAPFALNGTADIYAAGTGPPDPPAGVMSLPMTIRMTTANSSSTAINPGWAINGSTVNATGVPFDQNGTYALADYTGTNGTLVATACGLGVEFAGSTIDFQCVFIWPLEPRQWNLTTDSTAGGSVTVPGEGTYGYNSSTVVNITASPDQGFDFSGWTGDTGTIANTSAASTTITITSDCSITATFSPKASWDVTYDVTGNATLNLGVEGLGNGPLNSQLTNGNLEVKYFQETVNNSRVVFIDSASFTHTPIFYQDPLGEGYDFYLTLNLTADAVGMLYLAGGVGDVDVSGTTNISTNPQTTEVIGDSSTDPAGSSLIQLPMNGVWGVYPGGQGPPDAPTFTITMPMTANATTANNSNTCVDAGDWIHNKQVSGMGATFAQTGGVSKYTANYTGTDGTLVVSGAGLDMTGIPTYPMDMQVLVYLDMDVVPPPEGDVNDDGRRNCLDITLCELLILYPETYPPADYFGWDANEDGSGPNAGDVTAIEMRILETWPP
jgi:uncharacterized repeat protein (TIGR02543 family)